MASTKPSALLDTGVIYCGDNDSVRTRCLEFVYVHKQTDSFYCCCDWRASHYTKAMHRLDAYE